jgi:hypothetical protein
VKYDATLFKRAAAAASSKQKRSLSSDGSLASLDDDAAELSYLSKLSLSLPVAVGPVIMEVTSVMKATSMDLSHMHENPGKC